MEAGARRVVVGTAAVWEPTVLSRMIGELGPHRVVAAVDVRHGRARGAGWLDEGRGLDLVVDGLAAAGVGWVLVTSIERDGALTGPDVDLVRQVLDAVPVRVIGSGGVASLHDLRALREAGASAVVVGRALYESRFTLEQAHAVAGG